MEKRKASDQKENLDQLNAENDPEFTKQFTNQNEIIFLSCKVTKFNKYNWQQERNLIITNECIYNFKKKGMFSDVCSYSTCTDVKRIIPIEKLAGLTKSLRTQSKEFVIHVKKDYDYRLKSDIREKIFQAIKMAYTSKNKANLPIYGIKNKELREFATTEKDLEKGISRIPLQLARIYEEDVIEEDTTQDGKNAQLSEPVEIMDNYTKNMERRSRAYSNRGSTSLKNSMDPTQLLKDKDCTSQTIFQRQFTDGEVQFDDFRILSIVGKGTFGKVYLVQHTVTQKYYAMKSIRKDIVIEHDSLENLHLEKLILLQVNHPFIISMEFVFIKSLRIYFIMDFIRGGELFKHLSESKRFTEDRACFYSAQVALALGYLHKARIIYRDMKPENILLNYDGYILLADFGLAKINDVEGDEPNSFCGTPEYLSPEMIVGSGHDHTLDWWALGILIYEMIIGIPPFYNKNKHQMYYLIQHAPIRWPDKERHGISVSEDAKDLISKLLDKDRKIRLGFKNDVDEVLGHPFFKNIDVDKLIKKEIEAPFKPQLQSEYDLSNFDQKYVKLDLTESVLPEEGIQKIQAKKDAFEKWILVQPANKNLRGRYLEKVGYWIPRKTKTVQRAIIINKHRIQYWLGNGAEPTRGVHRLLEKFEFVPKYPPPFGSKTLYEKPQKEYNLEYHKNFGRGRINHDLYVRSKIQEQMNLIERKKRLQQEVQENLGFEPGSGVQNIEEAKTTDIESEEHDIFERKNKFEVLLKRLEKHRKETAHLRGNDLRYNIYMRKIQKLTRIDLGLDLEAYKDYINNLKQFAHVNKDFEIYARDSLQTDEIGMRQMIEFKDDHTGKNHSLEKIEFNVKCDEVLNTLRKLKRTTASFLQQKDKDNIEDLTKNLRKYLNNFEIYEVVKTLYDKRKDLLENKQQNDQFDFSKVKEIDLENSNVSRREFEQMKLLLSLDKDIFRPSEYGNFSPYSKMIDLTKYGDKIPKEAKELLYRPPKVKLLYGKYWQLAEASQGRVKEEFDRKILVEFFPRYPQKSADEMKHIDTLLEKLDQLIGEDEREVGRQKDQILKEQKAIHDQQNAQSETKSTRIPLEQDEDDDEEVSPIDELRSKIKADFYYEGASEEAFKKWNALTDEERAAQRRNDAVDDEVNTTDMENIEFDAENFDYGKFLKDNRINLARAFLGYDGGYSIRKLKKFMRQAATGEIQFDHEGKPYVVPESEGEEESEEESDEDDVDSGVIQDSIGKSGKNRNAQQSSTSSSSSSETSTSEEEGLSTRDGQAKRNKSKKGKEEIHAALQEGETAETLKSKADTPDGRFELYSDESGEDLSLRSPDYDSKWNQHLRTLEGKELEDEEQAKAFIEEYNKKVPRKQKDPRKPDTREQKNPYYGMMKDEINNIQVLTENRGSKTHMLTRPEDHYTLWDKAEQKVGRYPIGFRHYENYENYRILKPESSIQDYHDDMNRQIEYQEFKEITKVGYIQESEHPYFRWKRNLDLEFPDESKLEPILFDQLMSEEYRRRCTHYLLEKTWFKLVDALEEVTNLWTYGRNYYVLPRHNLYVPPAQTIMNRPDLSDDRNDDTSYRFDLPRVSPALYLNTLKTYKISPPGPPKTVKWDNFTKVHNKKFFKYRRLSRPRMLGHSFSTVNQRTNDEAEESRQRQMWYMMNFTNSLYGLTQNPVLYGEGTKFNS